MCQMRSIIARSSLGHRPASPPPRGRSPEAVASLRAAQVARDPHRALERLFVVEPWIDPALVGTLEIGVRQAARTAGALGDVLAGQLDVHAAEPRAELGVEREALLELVDDLVEPPGLDPA